MIEIIEEVKKHRDYNNKRICDDLIEILNNNKITSKEDLLKYEYSSSLNNNLEKRMDIKFNEYLNDTSLYDDLETQDMLNMKEYEKSYKDANNSLEKCKYLILLFDYVGYSLFFPYEALMLIIKDELKGNYDDEVSGFDKDEEFVGFTSREQIDEYLSYFDDSE